MTNRRQFLAATLATPAAHDANLTPKERVDRILKGQDPDRPAFTFWYHFLDEKLPGSEHAKKTLAFHHKLRTDIVKVMSDYPFPRPPKGEWHTVRPIDNPYPEQIKALHLIREGLAGKAHFIETIFNPWNVAEKLSSPEAVKKLKAEKPQALLNALEAIAKSEASHARKAIAAGASGVFLAIANAQEGIMTRADYAKFSEPFDRMVIDAVKDAPMNTLHLHGDKVWVDPFLNWGAPIVNYSTHGTGVPIAAVRKKYSGVIMGGLDERTIRKTTAVELKKQWTQAWAAAGKKYLVAPGCSVPNESTDEELLHVTRMFNP